MEPYYRLQCTLDLRDKIQQRIIDCYLRLITIKYLNTNTKSEQHNTLTDVLC